MIGAKKLISLITLAHFAASSGCVPMTRVNVDEARKDRDPGVSKPQPTEPAAISTSQPAEPADEPAPIREVTPDRPPLATGPIPSVPTAATPVAPASPAKASMATALMTAYQGRANDRSAKNSDYRIGEEDELDISVYGDTDLSKTQTVRPDGKVAFPLVGDIQALGLTPEELRRQLTQGIAEYVRDPRVTVVIKKYNSRRATILGEVIKPGPLSLGYDLSLLEGISRMGGLSENADLKGALLVRDGQVVPVDFDRLLRQGDVGQDVPLKPNDVVLIPDIRDRKAFVLGQVDKPLVVALKPDVTLVEAISRAGGVTVNADLQGALLVRDGQVVPVDFDRLLRQGEVSQNVLLKPNDAVFVPDIRDKKVFVLGQVDKPQVVALKPNVTLVEAISRAGGVTRDADLQGALLMRDGQALPVNFDKLIRKGDVGQNVLLKPDDVVLIPNILDKKVFVLGEVTKPLVVTARPGLRLVESIASAGGFTQDAQKKSVMIIRGGLGDPKLLTVNVDKLTRLGGLDQDVALEPGDIVYVPRTFIADVLAFFQGLTTILAPLVLIESGIVLGPAVEAVLKGLPLQGTGAATNTNTTVISPPATK